MSLPEFSTQAELFSTAGCSRELFPATDRYRLFARKPYPVRAQTRSELAACDCADNGRVAVEPVLLMGSACCSIWRAFPTVKLSKWFIIMRAGTSL